MRKRQGGSRLPATVGILLLLGSTAVSGSAHASSFSIGPVDGIITGPEGYDFVGLELRVSWLCHKSNALINSISPTGTDSCQRGKSGEVLVPIKADGTFFLPRISESRWSPFTHSSFIVQVEVLHNGGEGFFDRDEILAAVRVQGEIDAQLQSLQVIRFTGAETSARLRARLNGETLPLSEIKRKHPDSSISSTARVWVELPGRKGAISLAANLSHRSLRIAGRDVIVVGPVAGGPLRFELELRVSTQLRTKDAGFVHRSCQKEFRYAGSEQTADNRIPAQLIEPVELTLNLEEPSSCWTD
jgi:hypothetical protein